MTFPIAGSYGRCSVNAVSAYDRGVDAKSSNDQRSSMVASLEVRRKTLDGNAALGRTLVRQRCLLILLYAIRNGRDDVTCSQEAQSGIV